MQSSKGHTVIVLLLAGDLDGVLVPVAPELVELRGGAMTEDCARTDIEERCLQLRLPGPRVIGQSVDVRLQTRETTGRDPMPKCLHADSTATSLCACEQPVLRHPENGDCLIYLSCIHMLFHTS